MKPIIIQNEPNEVYHSKKEYVSNSHYKHIIKSPAHYKAFIEDKRPNKPTDAMLFGSACHTAILEPELYSKEVAVLKKIEADKTWATKINKDHKKEFEEANIGKIILDEEANSHIENMKDVLYADDSIVELLDDGIAEQSIYFKDKESGVKCKIRPDKVRNKSNVIVDLKTTQDASREEFGRSACLYGYHTQCAMYLDGASHALGRDFGNNFVIIAIEKEPPYAYNIFYPDEEFIAYGRRLYKSYLKQIAKCLEQGVYPNYRDMADNEKGLVELSLPSWYINKADIFLEEREYQY